jgi:glycosyltransferase involved in cell wall biosynthesis
MLVIVPYSKRSVCSSERIPQEKWERKLLVSVVIPAYNSANTICKAIDSVLNQDIPSEIIIVDDGSTDETVAVLQDYSDHIVLLHQGNQGAGSARNRGILSAHGDIVAFLDADDEWLPDKLDFQLKLFEQHPTVGVLSTAARYEDEAGNLLHIGTTDLKGNIVQTLLYTNFIVTSSVLIRKSCLDSVDTLFKSEFAPAEDWDFWIRLSARHEFLISPNVLVRYRVAKGGASHQYSPAYLRSLYISIYTSLLEDPQLKVLIEHNWKELLGNVHIKTARHYYESNQAWFARREIVACLLRSPGIIKNIKFRNTLAILFLPLPIWRGLRRLRAARYKRKLECFDA